MGLMEIKRMCRLLVAVALCLVLGAFSALAEESKAPENPAPATIPKLTEGSLSAHELPPVTVFGVADQPPSVPVMTRFGTQYNAVTEEQIARQNSLDFYDALRNVPGVMYQKKNLIGGQTGASLYIRGRGASHPSPDLSIFFDDVPRSGVLYGQALADGIPVFALGGMEVYKSPQPSRFGSGYGMINFIPKYMTEDGTELRLGFEGGSFGTFAENVGAGAKKDRFDIYAAQSHISTLGHSEYSAAFQNSYYVNTGVQLFDNWGLRFMANRVEAQTQAPKNPLTGARPTDRFDTETSLATLTLSNQYEKAHGYLKGYYNSTLFFLRGESNGTALSQQTNDLYGLRGRETFSLWEGGEFVLGFDLDATQLQNTQEKYGRTGTTKTVWDFPEQTLFSPYAAFSQMLGEKDGFHITPSAGVRYYSHNVFEDKAAPQAGLVVGYAHTNLAFNYAHGVNYPSPVVLQNYLGNKGLPAGFDTKKIKPEVVDHFEVALSHVQPESFSVSATWFQDNGRDRTRAYMFGGAPGSETFFNSSTAEYRINGLELAGRVTPFKGVESLKGLELFAGLTWLKAEAKGDDGLTTDKMPYMPSFALQTGFTWKFLENFQLSGDYQHMRNVYAATSARTSNPGAPASNFAVLTDVDKLPDINVVNLRLDYFFSYDAWKIEQGKVFIAVNNVLNTPYAYSLEKSGNARELYYMPGTSFMAGFELKF